MINWNVLQMQLYPQEQQMVDVVFNVNWKCSATDQGQTAWVTDNTEVVADSDNFIPYDQLTEDQVLGWVWGIIDKAAVEAKVTQALQDLINPPVVVKTLPWEEPAPFVPVPEPPPEPEPTPDPAPPAE